MVLDMTLRDIERVLYFEAYVVTDPGMTPLQAKQLLTEDDYLEQGGRIRRRVLRIYGRRRRTRSAGQSGSQRRWKISSMIWNVHRF